MGGGAQHVVAPERIQRAWHPQDLEASQVGRRPVNSTVRRFAVERESVSTWFAISNDTAASFGANEQIIGFVEELSGAKRQGATLEGARADQEEAIALVLEANRALSPIVLAALLIVKPVGPTMLL